MTREPTRQPQCLYRHCDCIAINRLCTSFADYVPKLDTETKPLEEDSQEYGLGRMCTTYPGCTYCTHLYHRVGPNYIIPPVTTSPQWHKFDVYAEQDVKDATLTPRKRFQMTPLHLVATAKAMAEATTPRTSFFIIAVQTPGSGISILMAVGTPSTGSGNLYCQWKLSPGSGNALCILFPTDSRLERDALMLAHRWISDLDSYLDKSEGREAAFERHMRAMEEHFGPAVQTSGSGISNLLAVATTFTGSGNLYCQWELYPGISAAGIQGYYCLQQKLMLPSSRVTAADGFSTAGWIKTEMA
nr:hypothetical protein [Tanacetum cinerariifolium]